ncbi:hypothetical protein TWF694_004724 [Orbilia ellipsospora]|uniref:DUF7918 domain-containing protein n=1 Tax=Orbilia ellipsospora TaxID=2528407 RepID=A0AAV9X254_9PEZI
MPTFKGITAEVYIDGKPTVEYATKKKGRICETYIVAEEGKEYKVKLQFGRTGAPRHGLDFDVDGQNLARWTTDMKAFDIAGGRYCYRKMGKVGWWEYRTLRFESLKIDRTGGSRDLEHRKSRSDNIGKMELKIQREHLEALEINLPCKERNFSPLGTISEKDMQSRGLSHGTALGDTTTNWSMDYSQLRVRDFDWLSRRYAQFIIYYASKEMLQAKGIIPMDPKVDQDLVGLDLTQLRTEVMRLREKKKTYWWWPFGRSKNYDDEKSTKKAICKESENIVDEKARCEMFEDIDDFP